MAPSTDAPVSRPLKGLSRPHIVASLRGPPSSPLERLFPKVDIRADPFYLVRSYASPLSQPQDETVRWPLSLRVTNVIRPA